MGPKKGQLQNRLEAEIWPADDPTTPRSKATGRNLRMGKPIP